jgi:hypothetical protein
VWIENALHTEARANRAFLCVVGGAWPRNQPSPGQGENPMQPCLCLFLFLFPIPCSLTKIPVTELSFVSRGLVARVRGRGFSLTLPVRVWASFFFGCASNCFFGEYRSVMLLRSFRVRSSAGLLFYFRISGPWVLVTVEDQDSDIRFFLLVWRRVEFFRILLCNGETGFLRRG